MRNHQDHVQLICQAADLLRGSYRPPQYERIMLPMTVLRRFDCVLEGTKGKVGYEINFNRYFYKYAPPRPLEEIDMDMKEAKAEIMRLLQEVTQ